VYLVRSPADAQSELQVDTAHRQQLSKSISDPVSKDRLQFLDGTSDRKQCNVDTDDETWLYFDNPRMSMWIGADVAKPILPRHTIGTAKCMFWILFSRAGIGAVAILPPGQSFNQDFFIDNVLLKIIDDKGLGHPKLKAHGTSLHLDSARPHPCNDEFEELGIRRLPHPQYSPDLALCDFWLSAILTNVLRDGHSAIQWHASGHVRNFDVDLSWDLCESVYRVEPHLRQCVEHGGIYL
jgi:hypothetical protein